jgi:5S rRNA maturation endonuclease (ribonuclease M5)
MSTSIAFHLAVTFNDLFELKRAGMSLQDILSKFKNVRRAGNGYSARCPAHDDHRNSLSIRECEGGRLLLYCHAGCTFEAICRAAGIGSQVDGRQGARRIVAAYDYCDERGELLYQAIRYEPKGFSQRRPDGDGWVYKLNGARRVPYRLPELLAADPAQPVFIVEGEKDADRLAALGFVATTNAGGAGKWRNEYNEHLRGRHVVIIPDNDEPGREHAAKVTRSLRGIAASVRVLKLPDLKLKGDVSDWLDAEGVVDELLVLAESAQECLSQEPEASPLQVVRMADVEPETVHWLWYPYIALGKLTILEGDPGLGKSWLMCAIAASVSLGRGLPGAEPSEPGNVLMLSAEDGLGDTLRPRLNAVEADVTRVFAVNVPLTFDAEGLSNLEAAIIEYRPKLVVIDPLFAYTGGKTDIHRANECRAISAPLAAIAGRCGCATVAVRHLGKSRGGGNALNAGIGSIDIAAAARSVLLVGQDPDDHSKRALVQTKNNLAPIGEGIGYTLEGGRFYWTGATTLTAGRILSLPLSEEERGARAEAVEFLRSALADGPCPSKEIASEARNAGISESTLRRAKAFLGIRAVKDGGHFGGGKQKWLCGACRLLSVAADLFQMLRPETPS